MKPVSRLFNIPGGHSEVDASAGAAAVVAASLFSAASAPGGDGGHTHGTGQGNRHRVREVHIRELQLSTLIHFPTPFSSIQTKAIFLCNLFQAPAGVGLGVTA